MVVEPCSRVLASCRTESTRPLARSAQQALERGPERRRPLLVRTLTVVSTLLETHPWVGVQTVTAMLHDR